MQMAVSILAKGLRPFQVFYVHVFKSTCSSSAIRAWLQTTPCEIGYQHYFYVNHKQLTLDLCPLYQACQSLIPPPLRAPINSGRHLADWSIAH